LLENGFKIVEVTAGPAYFIPVRIIRGTPMISDKQFKPGKTTLIKSTVEISPALDFLVIIL
jgi:hypothetical protein